MQVRIGAMHVSRELSIETDMSAAEVKKAVEDALRSETNILVLTDDKGGQVVVPSTALAYVEIGAETSRRVGFGVT